MKDDQRYLEDLLGYPAESRQKDYKASVAFKEDTDFVAKLVKHILGFSNSGGGHIIIGFKQADDNSLVPDEDLSEAVASSYEVTRLCQFVERFIEGQERAEVLVHKIKFAGRKYPIISVYPFRDYPFVCTKNFSSKGTGEPILEAGQIYVRVHGARTMPLKSPSEWHQLINECLAARERREAAKRPEGPGKESGPEVREPKKPLSSPTAPTATTAVPTYTAPDPPTHAFLAWLREQRNKSHTDLKEHKLSDGFFEFWIQMPPIIKGISNTDLLSLAEKAECHNTGWPIGVVMTRPEYQPIPLADGIRAAIRTDEGYDYWALHRKGHFYFARSFSEESNQEAKGGIEKDGKKLLLLDIRIWRIAESLVYCSNLCRELNLDLEQVVLYSIRHAGLSGRVLGVYNPYRASLLKDYTCHVNDRETVLYLQAGSITGGLKDHVFEVSSDLFEMFDFYKADRAIVSNVVDEFMKSRV